MKRFFTFFFFLFAFAFAVFGQNLIPDPFAEDVIECPSSLGNIDIYTSSWQSFRGTPDYWNSCSVNPLLGWDNNVGYQEPRSGEGYLGAGLHHTSLSNAREYLGIELLEPLQIGETYHISFHISLAYRISGGTRTACNNMGFLLMTENYLDNEEQGEILNWSHFSVDTILTDTTNWVLIETDLVADSSYAFLAFGNFYDDLVTSFEFPFEPDNAGISYYYFDDFCVTTDQNGCEEYLETTDIPISDLLEIWPNPTSDYLNFTVKADFSEIQIHDLQGRIVYSKASNYPSSGNIQFNLSKGIYLIEFITEKERITKRFMVQ